MAGRLNGGGLLEICNAGHNPHRVVKAIQDQAAEMDYAPHFNFGHPAAFEAAEFLMQELGE